MNQPPPASIQPTALTPLSRIPAEEQSVAIDARLDVDGYGFVGAIPRDTDIQPTSRAMPLNLESMRNTAPQIGSATV